MAASSPATITVLDSSGQGVTGVVRMLLSPAPTDTPVASIVYSRAATPAVQVLTDLGVDAGDTGRIYQLNFTLDAAPSATGGVDLTISVADYGLAVTTVAFEGSAVGVPDAAFQTALLAGAVGVDGAVSAYAVQDDGLVLIGGAFNVLGANGAAGVGLVRLTALGATDTTFTGNLGAGLNNTVAAIAVQADQKILVGGTFTAFDGTTANRLVRLNTDGTLDTDFATNLGVGFASTVTAIAVQADQKILVGGNFTTMNGTTVNRLVRLNADGTRDTAFSTAVGSGFNTTVTAIAVQADQKILVGGSFNIMNATTAINRLVRLSTTGARDTAFTTAMGSGFNSDVNAIAVQTDQKIVVGGAFSSLNAITIGRLVRLTTTGARDVDFTSALGGGTVSSTVSAVALQADQKILVGGVFTVVGGVTTNRMMRLGADGTRETAFYTNLGANAFNNTVSAICVQSDQKILAGGLFATMGGVAANRVVRLATDGTRDTTFVTALGTGFSDNVAAVAVQADKKIVVGGSFQTLNGASAIFLARLNADGSRDAAFTTALGNSFSSAVYAVAVQADQKILVGGAFTTLNGTNVGYLVRLNTDGTRDVTFSTNLGVFNNTVTAIAVQADQSIIVGGTFTTLKNVAAVRLVRITSTGARDTGFTTTLGTGPNSTVSAIAVQADQKILIGGFFATVGGATVNRMARLATSGARDTAFSTSLGTGFDSNVSTIAVLADQKIVVGGAFTALNGTAANYLVGLATDGTRDPDFTTSLGTGFDTTVSTATVQADRKIVLGGAFTTLNGAPANYLVRLGPDGTRDADFTASLGAGPNNAVNTVALQTDKMVVGGAFTSLSGNQARRLARIA